MLISLSACAPAALKKQSSPQVYPLRPAVSGKNIYHYVRRGESLWKISKMYSVSVEEIMEKNRISSPESLLVGQKILIPYRPTANDLTFLWPVKGEVLNFFGENIHNSLNNGLNIKIASGDENVSAAAAGKVVFSRYLKGWGKTVILKHNADFYTIYANITSVLVEEGNHAKKGQVIGKAAPSDRGACLLHFEIRKAHIPQNPLKYLN